MTLILEIAAGIVLASVAPALFLGLICAPGFICGCIKDLFKYPALPRH